MENINELYSDYLMKKYELDKEYNKNISEFMEDTINKCKIKKGMILKYNNRIGRVLYVGFVGIDGNQNLQAMFKESSTRLEFPINENEFDKVEILEEPDIDINSIDDIYKSMCYLKSSVEGQILKLRLNLETKLKNYNNELKKLQDNCVHNWKLCKNSDDRPIYECLICGKKETI